MLVAAMLLAGCMSRSLKTDPGPVQDVPKPKAETTDMPALSLTRTPKEDTAEKKTPTPKPTEKKPEAAATEDIAEDGYYYDLESVVLYIDKYGKLPPNYITKKEAKSLGWEGGSIDDFKKDAAIGGDYYGNYEKKLPEGPKYTECDIDTHGKKRGVKRLVFSNKGDYFYTQDHYESFKKVSINGGTVIY